jgi:hypothetical protein
MLLKLVEFGKVVWVGGEVKVEVWMVPPESAAASLVPSALDVIDH